MSCPFFIFKETKHYKSILTVTFEVGFQHFSAFGVRSNDEIDFLQSAWSGLFLWPCTTPTIGNNYFRNSCSNGLTCWCFSHWLFFKLTRASGAPMKISEGSLYRESHASLHLPLTKSSSVRSPSHGRICAVSPLSHGFSWESQQKRNLTFTQTGHVSLSSQQALHLGILDIFSSFYVLSHRRDLPKPKQAKVTSAFPSKSTSHLAPHNNLIGDITPILGKKKNSY